MPTKQVWRAGDVAQGPAAWFGENLQDQKEQWAIQFTDQDVAEIETSLSRLKSSGAKTLSDMGDDPAAFPLNGLSEQFARARSELKDGVGFFLFRGLPVERYDLDDAGMIFRGIASHIGACVSQNYRGELVGQVIDRSDEIADPRRYEAGGEFRMHVDPIDIVALMCMRKAKQGGESQVVSALAVHNVLLEERPDLASVLYEGYRLFRPYPDRGDTEPLTSRKVPFFAPDEGGEFAAYFLPDPAIQALERESVHLTELEHEALNYAESVAARPGLVLNMDLLPGDIQFLNNRKILHSRAGYEDFEEKERRRLMLRMWLMVKDWPSLSPEQRFFDQSHKFGGGILPQAH